jgi:hypothetical protein
MFDTAAARYHIHGCIRSRQRIDAYWAQGAITWRTLSYGYNPLMIMTSAYYVRKFVNLNGTGFRIRSRHVGHQPITVVARSKAWAVFPRSNTGVVGSNPTQGMDVCVRLFCVCVVLCVGSTLTAGWSPDQGVLPTVYRKSGQGPKGCTAIEKGKKKVGHWTGREWESSPWTVTLA